MSVKERFAPSIVNERMQNIAQLNGQIDVKWLGITVMFPKIFWDYSIWRTYLTSHEYVLSRSKLNDITLLYLILKQYVSRSGYILLCIFNIVALSCCRI